MNVSRNTILGVHLFVSGLLAYLSYMITKGRKVPKSFGVFLGVLAVGVLVVHVFFYSKKSTIDKVTYGTLSGLHFDPNDSDYIQIGGRPGGVTWN